MANYFLSSAHRYHPCPPKHVPSADRFCFTMQPPKSYSVGGQRSSRAAYRKHILSHPQEQERKINWIVYLQPPTVSAFIVQHNVTQD
ncbi:UNVERIFIED_CONTAM: hypothetical protein FKN15_038809 [Acipenser sinensis]